MGVVWLSKKTNSVGKVSTGSLNVRRCGLVDPAHYLLQIKPENFGADLWS